MNTKEFPLDVRELLLGEPNRLRHVIRFGNCHKVHHESVAEHSYYTALYAMFLGEWLNAREPGTVDMVKLLAAALLHDVEEARSGDFPRPFKYSSVAIRDALNEASTHAFTQCVQSTVCKNANAIAALKGLWTASKDRSIEGRVLSFADYLSVVGYLHLEVTGSNLTMRQHVNDMAEYAAEFKDSSYDPLRPLIESAAQLVKEFLHGLE